MTSINRTLICKAEDRDTVEAVCAQFPGGAGTFGTPLTTFGGGRGPITHYAGSGVVDASMVAALQNLSNAIVMVLDLDGTDIFTQLVACDPPLNVVVGSM